MLTKRVCDRATFDPSGPIQQIVYDGALPGFGLRLHSTGRKTFVVRYRTRSGRQRYYTIARYGVATAEEARARAKRVLLEAADGQDPQSERQQERVGLTVSDFCTLYLDQYAKPKKRSWKQDDGRIEGRIKPAWGNRKLREITRGDVEALHVKIGSEGSHAEANRVLALVSTIFTKAVEWGDLPEESRNPARGIKKYPEQPRKRFVEKQEMPRLYEAINEEKSPYIRGVLLLLLLTGCRQSELLGARWEDVDWNRLLLALPQTKAFKEQVGPLSTPALALLKMIPRQHNNPYIFPSTVGEGKHLVDLKGPWQRIRQKAGTPDLTMHDLRRTVGSMMAEKGASQVLIAEVLRHSSLEATAIYTQIANGAAARALEDHGAEVERIAGW